MLKRYPMSNFKVEFVDNIKKIGYSDFRIGRSSRDFCELWQQCSRFFLDFDGKKCLYDIVNIKENTADGVDLLKRDQMRQKAAARRSVSGTI